MSIANLLGLILLLSSSGVLQAQGPQWGQPVDQALINKWDRDIFPNGQGLPDGQGDAIRGRIVYEKYCLSCHGINGTGDSAVELAGAMHGLTDEPPDKTIGTYWPYATTIFDFIRRSMPLNAPAILNNDQIYGVTAYLLYLNGLIGKQDTLNRQTLAQIRMPNRNGFINVYEQQRKSE